MCLIVVRGDGRLLPHIPQKFKTHEIYIGAVKQYPKIISQVPQFNMTTTMYPTWMELITLYKDAYAKLSNPTEEMTTLHKILWEV